MTEERTNELKKALIGKTIKDVYSDSLDGHITLYFDDDTTFSLSANDNSLVTEVAHIN